jgi:hypothetical protein
VETTSARLVTGSTGTVVGPVGVRVRFTVSAVDDAARTWAWRATLGPIRLHLTHEVTAREDGTATVLRVSGPLPVIAFYAPLAQLALGRLVRP